MVEQLFHGLAAHGVEFGNDLIWDPCCGAGNVLDVAKRYGHPTLGSDLIDRGPAHPFFLANALSLRRPPPSVKTEWDRGRGVSIISNTPYSYQDQIAERLISHLLETLGVHVRRFAFIVPIAFLASQDRWGPRRLLRWRPSHVAFYRERHSMPPGHMIDRMARPYDGGMADYAVLVFTPPHRWRTEALWLPPERFPDPPRRAPTQKETTSG